MLLGKKFNIIGLMIICALAGYILMVVQLRPSVFAEAERGVREKLTNADSASISNMRIVRHGGEERICGHVTAMLPNGMMKNTRFIWQRRIKVAQIEVVGVDVDCRHSASREEALVCVNGYPDPNFQLAWLAKC